MAAAVALPHVVEGAASGVVDLARSLPQLVETGQIQGPKEFWSKAALTFGTGVAYDILFNVLGDFYRMAASPTVRAIRGFKLDDPALAKKFVDSAGQLDSGKLVDSFNTYLSGNLPQELLENLTPQEATKLTGYLERTRSLMNTTDFNINTPQGFTLLAKGMGFDVVDDGLGKVRLLDGEGRLEAAFKSRPEAVSYFMAKGWRQNMPSLEGLNALLGGQRAVKLRSYQATNLRMEDLPDAQLNNMINAGFRGQDVHMTTEGPSDAGVHVQHRTGSRFSAAYQIWTWCFE
jgi:hypothetical protein